MGYFSELTISMMESPQLTGLHKFVCPQCVADEVLAKLVVENAKSSSCSYCGEESEDKSMIAAPYDIIMKHIYDTIFMYYGDAQDVGMPYIEKEWLLPETDLWEIIGEFDPGWPGDFCDDLIGSADPNLYLVKHVNEDWTLDTNSNALKYGWSAFKEQVLYKTRYLFLSEPEDKYSAGRPDYIPVSKMMDALGVLCYKEGLIKKIPLGTKFYRVRSGSGYTCFKDIGVPPEGAASAGRMNPPGISYFYIAYDSTTAEKEVLTDQTEWTSSEFTLLKEINVIDFVELPTIPSIFETDKYNIRQELIFLNSFVNDLTLPIQKDGREHVDYVPTQIISEYFRYRFRLEDGESVLGLRYSSVKNEHGVNVAIFSSDNNALAELFSLDSVNVVKCKE